jgi:hypothetical protein
MATDSGIQTMQRVPGLPPVCEPPERCDSVSLLAKPSFGGWTREQLLFLGVQVLLIATICVLKPNHLSVFVWSSKYFRWPGSCRDVDSHQLWTLPCLVRCFESRAPSGLRKDASSPRESLLMAYEPARARFLLAGSLGLVDWSRDLSRFGAALLFVEGGAK